MSISTPVSLLGTTPWPAVKSRDHQKRGATSQLFSSCPFSITTARIAPVPTRLLVAVDAIQACHESGRLLEAFAAAFAAAFSFFVGGVGKGGFVRWRSHVLTLQHCAHRREMHLIADRLAH